MPKYKVFVEWAVTATVEVEADTLDEAIFEVHSNPHILPKEGDYMEGSLEVNHEVSEYINSKPA